MTPERKAEISGHLVEEYYWNGTYCVYIDNRLSSLTWNSAVEQVKGPADVR